MALDRYRLARMLQGLPAARRRQVMQRMLGKLGGEVSRQLGGGRAAREVGRVLSGGGFSLGPEMARYARGGTAGGFLRGMLGRLGPVGKIVNWLFGKAEKPKDAKPSALREAVNLLQDLGFEVRLSKNLEIETQRPERKPEPSPADQPPPEGPAQPVAATPGAEPQPPTGTLPGNKMIFMQPVHGSSNVYAFGYDEATLTLRVQYLGATISAYAVSGKGHRGRNRVRGTLGRTVTNTRRGPGPLYDYHGVPKRVFERMKSAGSKGKFIWDTLRIRGTVYGHKFDYELVGASIADVVVPRFNAAGQLMAGKTVGRVTYVPRRAVGPGQFQSRSIKQGVRTFRSLLPSQGMPGTPPRDSGDRKG